MTVYVDPISKRGWMIRGRSTPNCHMFTDGQEAELHAIADKIGMRRAWYQAKASTPHYDLTPQRRELAIAAGAVEVDRRTAVRIWRQIRSKKTCPRNC